MRKNNEESVVRRKTSLSVSSFITPHHLVADKLIENIFSEVARQNKRQKIDRVILVSPNHFNVGQGEIIVADNSLLGEGNNFRVDKVGLQKLLAIDFVHKDANAFYKEHGIKGLLPFVQKYFPDTAVINLMIKDGTSAEKMKRLARVVSGLEGETLVILSSDFSHYLSSSISRWHDKKAVDIISHFDYPAVYNLETDCTPGLYFLMKFSELQNYKQFVWVNNSNSSQILGGDFVGENTSYVTGYFSKNNRSREKNTISQAGRLTNILFFGDLMLDRHNRTLMNEKGVGYFTEKIERLFWGQDLNVVNLEGPITENKSLSLGMPVENPNHFRFTFNPEQAINFLQANRINLVNIGNNHILNFHNDGLKQTEEFLEKGGINYFGDPTNLEKMFVIKNVNNHQIAFVSYNRFGKFTVADTIKIIREIRDKVDFIIVYTHWGQEYKLVENEKQTAKAHQFIDAGADLTVDLSMTIVP
jgi:poly-gamma-glutamate synthesis protein (capsule biosynthesis protein)